MWSWVGENALLMYLWLNLYHSKQFDHRTPVWEHLSDIFLSVNFFRSNSWFMPFSVHLTSKWWRHWRRQWVFWGPNTFEIIFWICNLVIKPKIPNTVSINSKDDSSEVLPLFGTSDNQRQNILGFWENEVFWPTSPQNQCCITFFQLKWLLNCLENITLTAEEEI